MPSPSTPAALSHIAIVTGARGGIGRQVVQRLRTQGHRVAVVGRDAASLDSLAADARIAADTTEPQGAQAAIAACRRYLAETFRRQRRHFQPYGQPEASSPPDPGEDEISF